MLRLAGTASACSRTVWVLLAHQGRSILPEGHRQAGFGCSQHRLQYTCLAATSSNSSSRGGRSPWRSRQGAI